MAAYKQAYDVMMIGLIDYRLRLPSMRWVPDVRKVSSVVDKSFRACPPEEVLVDATRIIAEEKAKAKWAKTKIARDKKMPGGRPRMRFRTRRMSPSEVTDLFHSRAMSQRLKRALPRPDLPAKVSPPGGVVVRSGGDADC